MSFKQQYYENAAATIIKNLQKRQMVGYYCPDRASALQKVLELIPSGASVGWGGSVTLNETGILDAVRAGDYQVLDRDTAVTPAEQKKMYGAICAADCFLMSTNAITLDGELVNVDNRGNRVSFLCFGPDKVIVVAGMNKVVPDVESGIRRTRDIAAPPNTLRLNRKTPCSVTGRCGDCQSPDCICAQTVITRRSAFKDRIVVVLVGEELGY